MSDEVCAAAATAAYLALAALIGICSAVILFSPFICSSLTAHAALVAHRLGCVDDAEVGLLMTAMNDLQ